MKEKAAHPELGKVGLYELVSEKGWLNLKTSIILPPIVAMAEDGVPRVIPSYSPEQWDGSPNYKLKELQQGQACMKALRSKVDAYLIMIELFNFKLT
jgi:hypothetical protein